ncbi:MAG: Uma2 family endonuclease [Cyanobacteria bacterium J06606_4]
MVLKYDPKQYLPTAAELPDSDDTPVDNELQNLIPNLLGAILAMAWSERVDWFFGVNMGMYFDPKKPAIVPDGFLSLGVERFVGGEQGRLSYVFWEENYVVPTFALEVVSKTYGGEYERKKEIYARIGIRYYAIYWPNRRPKGHAALAVYELIDGSYEQMAGDTRVWLPEIGLALGRERGRHRGWEREWLYWYDESGTKLPTLEEKAQQAESQAAKLAAKLRELGVDPSEL